MTFVKASCFVLYIFCACFSVGIVIGIPSAPIMVLPWAAKGSFSPGSTLRVGVPLTSVYDVALTGSRCCYFLGSG